MNTNQQIVIGNTLRQDLVQRFAPKPALALALVSLLATAAGLAAPLLPGFSPTPTPPWGSRPWPGDLRYYTCPDPAATRIDFSLVSRTSPFSGQVRISGTVKNVGTAGYRSGANQQIVLLYEQVPGGVPRLVASRPFQNLALGAEVSVSFIRNWNVSSSAEGEFPPSYRVAISYDPDILVDGNPMNDDCVRSNNSFTRSGSGVRALIR